MNARFRKYGGDVRRLAADLWRKLRGGAAHVPFAEDALSVYYCALDRETPLRVRAAIVGALAYFILPADAMPDFMPALGFTDDAAVLAATLKLVVNHLRPEHREAAQRAFGDLQAAQPE